MTLFDRLMRVRYDRDLRHAFRTSLLDEDGKPTPHGSAVLAHLRAFCSADVSTLRRDREGRVDPLASAAAQGRQEVWQQFYFYLNLDDSELVEIDREFTQQLKDRVEREQRTYQ
jgi:hypothetical protein